MDEGCCFYFRSVIHCGSFMTLLLPWGHVLATAAWLEFGTMLCCLTHSRLFHKPNQGGVKIPSMAQDILKTHQTKQGLAIDFSVGRWPSSFCHIGQLHNCLPTHLGCLQRSLAFYILQRCFFSGASCCCDGLFFKRSP